MALINHDIDPDGAQNSSLDQLQAIEADDFQSALDALYPPVEIAQKTADLLDACDFAEKANGRRWAVAVLDGSDPTADIAKRVEAERFSSFFGTHPAKHISDYGIYDESSIFVTVIDATSEDGPKAASALRIVHNGEKGLKSINTLSDPDIEENPWANDIKQVVGDFDYGDRERVKTLIEQAMHIDPEKTWAIESMAALEEYAGKHGLVGEATFPLYAACLQLSNMAGTESWVSIQDLKPMLQMQELFNDPWEWLPLPPRQFEGPFPTIPAYISDMRAVQEAFREVNPDMASLLIDGEGLSDSYVMPEELQGEGYLQQIASTE